MSHPVRNKLPQPPAHLTKTKFLTGSHATVITAAQLRSFRQRVYRYYRAHGRTLPWRLNTDPCHILVSEIMLQQTRVDRVIPKFNAFISAYPTFEALAGASLAEILTLWQGLGYNRRARALHLAAREVVQNHHGKLPHHIDDLQHLPGVGPYTAGAIMAFAFNQPAVIIETNIRTVFIHHFFPEAEAVRDAQLLPLITATLDQKNPRQWYWALMDYGLYLKKEHPNPSRRSAHHVKQGAFTNSNRQIRGAIIKALAAVPSATAAQLQRAIPYDATRIADNLHQLHVEEMIVKQGRKYALPL